jgi:hypothetical protein
MHRMTSTRPHRNFSFWPKAAVAGVCVSRPVFPRIAEVNWCDGFGKFLNVYPTSESAPGSYPPALALAQGIFKKFKYFPASASVVGTS